METKVRHGNLVSLDEKKKDTAVSIVVVIIFSALLSAGLAMFITPFSLYGSGVTGISQIIIHIIELVKGGPAAWNTLTDKYLGLVSYALLLPFNILAWVKLSRKYALYTLLSSTVQAAVLELSGFFSSMGVFRLGTNVDILAASITAAVIFGVGNGMLMRRGATSGGVIVLCQYLSIKKGKTSVGSINTIVCSLIIVGGMILDMFRIEETTAMADALSNAFYTLLCYVLSSVILDYIHTAYNKVKLEVITEKGALISNALVKEFVHGVTIQKGVGAYTNNEKEILNIVIHRYECNKYLNIIRSIDNDAFVSIIPIWRLNGRFNIQIIDK